MLFVRQALRMTFTHLQIVEVDDLVEGNNGHFCSCRQSGLTPMESCTIAASLVLLFCGLVILVGHRTAILLCAVDDLLERSAHLLEHRVRVQFPVLRIVADLLAPALRCVARDVNREDVVERLRRPGRGEGRARSEWRRILHPIVLWHDKVYRPSQ
jgi:hypothetical protein